MLTTAIMTACMVAFPDACQTMIMPSDAPIAACWNDETKLEETLNALASEEDRVTIVAYSCKYTQERTK